MQLSVLISPINFPKCKKAKKRREFHGKFFITFTNVNFQLTTVNYAL